MLGSAVVSLPMLREAERSRMLRIGGDSNLFFSKLFYFFAVLDFVDKNLGRLKAWNKVLVNNQGSISGDVSGNLLFSLFVDKASEAADVNVVTIRHRTLYYTEKCFHGRCYISFVNSGLFSDLVNNICFGHCLVILGQIFFGRANLVCLPRIKNEY